MRNCKRCNSERVLTVGAHASDMFYWGMTIRDGDQYPVSKDGEGYLPREFGIGAGDDLRISLCLDCGQEQGKYPVAPTEFEQDVDPDE
jgi:hypothetical protein